MKRVLITVLVIVAVLVAAFGLAIALGGPGEAPPMSSINDPFKNVDFSDLPELSHFTARDGAKIAFRRTRQSTTRSRAVSCWCTAPPPVAAACM